MVFDLLTLPYLIGACCYFILAVRLLLLPRDSQTTAANRFLALLFMLFFWQELDEFFDHNDVPYLASVLHDYSLTLSQLLLGPLTYLYIVNMVSKTSLAANVKHFSPLVVMCLTTVLVFGFFSEQRAEQLLTPMYILLYLATLLAYVLMSLSELKQYVGGSKAFFSNLNQHNLNWARAWIVFMLFIALYVALGVVYQFMTGNASLSFDLHYMISGMAVLLLMWPDSAQQIAIPQNMKEEVANSPEQDQFLTTAFGSIQSTIVKQKLYLKNGLTLADLADLSGYSSNDVSAAINQNSGACFYDYINDFRVEASQQLLLQYRRKPIIDIAMEAGFNSKSAFYNAFSKKVKQTPSEYRKIHEV
jgi:AraC-like DNA-binding protein